MLRTLSAFFALALVSTTAAADTIVIDFQNSPLGALNPAGAIHFIDLDVGHGFVLRAHSADAIYENILGGDGRFFGNNEIAGFDILRPDGASFTLVSFQVFGIHFATEPQPLHLGGGYYDGITSPFLQFDVPSPLAYVWPTVTVNWENILQFGLGASSTAYYDNFVIELNGTEILEPSTLLLLALGVPALRRRLSGNEDE